MKIESYDYLLDRSKYQRYENLLEFLDRHISKKSIIVWDLDYTLLGPNTEIFKLHNISSHRSIFMKCLERIDSYRHDFLNYLCYKIVTVPLQQQISNLFKEIHNNECHTIALSSMTYKPMFEIQKPHEYRLRILNESKIFFTDLCSFSSSNYLSLGGMVLSNSVLKEGKALALKSYIESNSLDIDKVVYIDDNTDNFKELSRYMSDDYPIEFFEFLDHFDPDQKIVPENYFLKEIKREIEIFLKKKDDERFQKINVD